MSKPWGEWTERDCREFLEDLRKHPIAIGSDGVICGIQEFERRDRSMAFSEPKPSLIEVIDQAIAQPDVFDLPGLLKDARDDLVRNRELFSRLIQANEVLTSTVRSLTSIASLSPDRTL